MFSVWVSNTSANRFEFGKIGKRLTPKNLGRVLIFERCSTLLLAEVEARQRELWKVKKEMPECKFFQLTGNSTSLIYLVILKLAAGGARISYLQIVISYMQ